MSYRALYREWRPQVFEDVIGQEHIVRTLKNQLLSGRIPHAYLFCGTRGTGKTTTAKILSKAVNCLNPQDGNPCNECEICREINGGNLIDVIEMDAASNRRVENARDLIDSVKHPPYKARYKVYIIDEVHMLTMEAFNTLLKTLEEPPASVMFILATTDPQKLPVTILSRCQRFDFKRIKTDDITMRLRRIVQENNVSVEDRTLNAISRVSDGAMRDALSILDQAMSMSEGRVEYNDVVSMLGLATKEHIFQLVDAIIERNIEASIKIIDDVILSGKEVVQFIKDITEHLRNLLMVKVSKKSEDIIDASTDTINSLKEQSRKLRSEEIMRAINIIVECENDAKYTSQPRILLEMAVIKICKSEYDTSVETLVNRINVLEEKLKSGVVVSAGEKEKSSAAPKQQVRRESSVSTEVLKAEKVQDAEREVYQGQGMTLDEVRTSWQDILNLLKANKKMTIYALLHPGDVLDVKGNEVVIGFDEKFGFSKTNLENPVENKRTAEEYFTKILNKPVRLSFKILREERGTASSIEQAMELLGDDIVEIIE